MKKDQESGTLRIVQKFFPEVTSVTDAVKPIQIEVAQADSKNAKVRNHQACAMAVACKRAMKADGVIVALTKAYVIMGKRAVRYQLPESVSREVISFDREAGFAPGTYQMSVPNPNAKLGAIRGGHNRENEGTGKKKKFIHHTTGIRVLGSEVSK